MARHEMYAGGPRAAWYMERLGKKVPVTLGRKLVPGILVEVRDMGHHGIVMLACEIADADWYEWTHPH